MPPAISNNRYPASSTTAARPSNKRPSRPTQQVIEIDDSSDDEQEQDASRSQSGHIPAGIALAAARARRMSGNTSGTGTSSSNGGQSSTSTRRAPISVASASRRHSQLFVDDSATEQTSEDTDGEGRDRRTRTKPAQAASLNLDHLFSGQGGSSASGGAPAASTSRNKASDSKANTSSRQREVSTSATEDSSADDAPVVTSSARRVPRPVHNEINNNNLNSRVPMFGRSSLGISRTHRMKTGINGTKASGGRRDMPDPPSDPTSDSDSSETTVASTARATAARARTRATKRALEPEVTVISTKRGRTAASGASAGPSTTAPRTRGRGASTAGSVSSSTSNIAAAPIRVSAKGKGRAPRSSLEPVSSKKPSGKDYQHASTRISDAEIYGSFFEQLQEHTGVSPGAATLYGSTTRTSDASVSKVITKIVIKPTDLSEELECAICSEIMVSPVNLVCGHTFCDACVGPWLDTNKDCPSCRTKMETPPVRSYLADRIIKKYLDSVYASLEAEGKHKEAKKAREERASSEREAEARRMKAAADKNKREAAAAAAAALIAARGARHGGAAFPPWRYARGPQAGLPPRIPAAAQPPPPARRGARAPRAQAQAAAEAAPDLAAAAAAARAGNAAGINNAGQFGHLLQRVDGALHVDPNALQQTADDMGIPVHTLFQMMFQG